MLGRIEIKTRTDYEGCYRNYIEPAIGYKNIGEIAAKDVRALIKPHMDRPHLAHKIKAVLGSIFTSLVEEEVVEVNPTKGVRMPKITRTSFTPLSPQDFKKVVEQLNEPQRLFAKFLVGSGLRFSEGAALHLTDFNPQTRELQVRRRVSRVRKIESPDGTGLLIQESTKSKQNRVVPLSEALSGELMAFVQLNNLSDILFPTEVLYPYLPPKAGGTWSEGGRNYLHGTAYSYGGGCRCELCLRAVAYAKYLQVPLQRSAQLPGSIAGTRPEGMPGWARDGGDACLASPAHRLAQVRTSGSASGVRRGGRGECHRGTFEAPSFPRAQESAPLDLLTRTGTADREID